MDQGSLKSPGLVEHTTILSSESIHTKNTGNSKIQRKGKKVHICSPEDEDNRKFLEQHQMNEKMQIFQDIFKLKLQENLSQEEQDFIKIQKFMNPITGTKGEEVSSETIKDCWINLLKMQKESNTSISKLQKMKQEYYVQ